MKTERFFVLLVLLMVVSVGVNAQAVCGQFAYSKVFNSCVTEFVLPWVPVSHIDGKPGEGYTAHLTISNNTTGTVAVLDTQFTNTAPDGTVQQYGHVIISENGQSMDSQGISTTLSPGSTVSFDIVDTKCEYGSNLCTVPPAEMHVAVKVIVGGDPQLLSNIIPPTVNDKDTINGKMAWQYKYDATALNQATTAVSANVYVGGSTDCAVAVMNVSIGGSQEVAEIAAYLIDPVTGETFDQGTFGPLLADQNAAMDCKVLFPGINSLKAAANYDLLLVTTALTNKLAGIVPQIENGGGLNEGAHVTSSTVFPNLQGMKGLK